LFLGRREKERESSFDKDSFEYTKIMRKGGNITLASLAITAALFNPKNG